MIYFTTALVVLSAVYLIWRSRRNKNIFASIENEALFERNCKIYKLSYREIEVLRLVVQGKTYSQVSELLFISKKTVDSHIQHIYAKMNVSNKIELIQKLYRV